MLKIFLKSLRPKSFQRYAATQAAAKTKHAAKNAKNETDEYALIQCKRNNFNLYKPLEAHCKFGTIPLASSGWMHRKSTGDWFKINSTLSENDISKEMQDIDEFLRNSETTFDDTLIQNLKTEFEINTLTNIQSQGWPKVCEKHHTLIAAETGCGKTLCYVVPIIQHIINRKVQLPNKDELNSPFAIILTPGRELATQIGSVIKKLTNNLNVKVKTILGGNTKRLMMNPDFDDVDIVVASMGAFSKLTTTGIYRMDYVKHVVLDEADTLLDDSFSPKLIHLLKRFPFYKNISGSTTDDGTQLVLASATMPTNITEQLQRIIDVETIHEVVSPHLHKIMPHVDQRFMRVNKSDRPAHLLTIVKKELSHRRPVIIFSNKTPTCDYVNIFLNNIGINCLNLNGDMLMKIRIGRFEKFQNGECDVLSTTDIGSRGLDTIRARHVVNFDFPLHVSDYIHRSGRIGRVGTIEKCVVTNFISSRREISGVQRIEHAARCGGLLPNVNANIKGIINKKIIEDMKEAEMDFP